MTYRGDHDQGRGHTQLHSSLTTSIDRNTWELSESTPCKSSSKKARFEQNTCAHIEGQCKTILHPWLDDEWCRRRILLPSSAWKDSSLLSNVEFSIQDSEPYIRIGMIQHSMILLADKGFSFPRKRSFPQRSLLIFESILVEQHRSGVTKASSSVGNRYAYHHPLVMKGNSWGRER